jgi:polyhydroxybutyrate depolymerase
MMVKYALRLVILGVGFLLPTVANADTMLVNGIERSFDVVRPKTQTKPAATLIVLHGGKGGAKQLRRYINMDDAASNAGAVTVYPNGINSQWNDGRTGTDGKPLVATDDVGFLDALIGKLVAEEIADPERIYFAGVSNGGMMSLRMACESRHQISGIAIIAANYPIGLSCTKLPMMKVLHFMGTADPIAPFAGGPISGWKDRGAVSSTEKAREFFMKSNGCKEIVQKSLPDKSPRDGTTVVLMTGEGCSGDARFVEYIIKGGGHTWPGARPTLKWLLGVTSQEISASEIITSEFLTR